MKFRRKRSYNIDDKTNSTEQLVHVLEDFAFNMKKKNSEDYKESVVKVMFNSTAKHLQEMFLINIIESLICFRMLSLQQPGQLGMLNEDNLKKTP